MIAILVGKQWYLTLAFIYISLMTNDVEHLLMYSFSICMSFLEKSLFRSFACVLILDYLPLLLRCKSTPYSLDTKPLSDICFENISFHSVGCLFTFLIVSFSAQTFLSQIYISFFFVICVFSVIYQKPLPNPRPQKCTPLLSSRSFTLLALTFWSLIHFELISTYDVS